MKRKWKTTDHENGQTGKKLARTFRDVSLINYDPAFIDMVDDLCIRLDVRRSTLIMLANDITKECFGVGGSL